MDNTSIVFLVFVIVLAWVYCLSKEGGMGSE